MSAAGQPKGAKAPLGGREPHAVGERGGHMNARFCCDQLCEQGRRCPQRLQYRGQFAPGVIDGPYGHSPTHSPRQLLWRWMRRTLALMAAVAIAGFIMGYLS